MPHSVAATWYKVDLAIPCISFVVIDTHTPVQGCRYVSLLPLPAEILYWFPRAAVTNYHQRGC